MFLQFRVHTVHIVTMVRIWVSLLPQLLSEDVTVLFIELGNHSLLRIETTVLLLLSYFDLELFSCWIVLFFEPSIFLQDLAHYFVHKDSLKESVKLVIEEVMSKLMCQEQGQLIFLHSREPNYRYGQEEPLIHVQVHYHCIIMHQSDPYIRGFVLIIT